MLNNVVYVVIGLVALVVGANFLIKGASRLATALGVSALIVGLTVVALGTSAPELIVSLDAALTASSDVALGNIVGSNIANIGLILAITGLISPVVIKWGLLRREIIVVIAVSLLTFVLALDGEIGRLDGVIFVACFLTYTFFLYRQGVRDRAEIEPELTQYEQEEKLIEKNRPLIEIGRIIIGLAALVVGANFLVDGATAIAREVGVSDLLIGLTLVAVGTSLPEFATCIIAAIRKENDIVFGNIVGSNIGNILFILGVVAIVQPVPVGETSRTIDIPVMIGFALALFPVALRGALKGWWSIVIIALYIGYLLWSFLR
jgi:cation:H+ antiporter